MKRSSRLRIGASLSLGILWIALALLWPGDPVMLATKAPAQITPTTTPLLQPDKACRRCHQAIYDNYQRTPMALGSGEVTQQADIPESGRRGFTHEPSGITYRVSVQKGQASMSYQRDGDGQRPALDGERKLAYFIGSGLRGRTFLYQQDQLWFETPINWYAKKHIWDMAPAYEQTSVMPAPLPVDANCLHCHAGDVQTATGGARNHFPDAPFRVPGVGCAACHGDPAGHLATSGLVRLGTASILNPDKLDPVRRDSICLQCHLEGDATVYLPGKSLASFKPGENLANFALYFVDENRAQQGGRATSQYEALLRSACKRAAGDKLTCTTCHDPHNSPVPDQRVAYFRNKCLTCHTSAAIASQHHAEQQDCAVCHMPTRKTLDISHEQLTDHDIEIQRPQLRLVDRVVVPNLVPVGAVNAGDRELGLAYAQLAQHGDHRASNRAIELLQRAERNGGDDNELHDQLGYLLQISDAVTAATREYEAALRQHPQDTTAAANLAVLYARQHRDADALRLLRQAFAEDPSQTAAALNLAFFDCRVGNQDDARAVIQKVLLFNPDSREALAFLTKGAYNGQTCDLR
jgi:predicted CXXCH cytochrome family protein